MVSGSSVLRWAIAQCPPPLLEYIQSPRFLLVFLSAPFSWLGKKRTGDPAGRRLPASYRFRPGVLRQPKRRCAASRYADVDRNEKIGKQPAVNSAPSCAGCPRGTRACKSTWCKVCGSPEATTYDRHGAQILVYGNDPAKRLPVHPRPPRCLVMQRCSLSCTGR